MIAEALGIDVETLRDELRSGATIAEIAEANGVDPQVVIDALVAEYTERVTAWIEGEQLAEEESTDTHDRQPRHHHSDDRRLTPRSWLSSVSQRPRTTRSWR